MTIPTAKVSMMTHGNVIIEPAYITWFSAGGPGEERNVRGNVIRIVSVRAWLRSDAETGLHIEQNERAGS